MEEVSKQKWWEEEASRLERLWQHQRQASETARSNYEMVGAISHVHEEFFGVLTNFVSQSRQLSPSKKEYFDRASEPRKLEILREVKLVTDEHEKLLKEHINVRNKAVHHTHTPTPENIIDYARNATGTFLHLVANEIYSEDQYGAKQVVDRLMKIMSSDLQKLFIIALPLITPEALRVLKFIRRKDPTFDSIYRLVAELHRQLGNARAELEALKDAVRINDQDHQAWNQLGRRYLLAGQKNKARKCFKSAVDAEPDKPSYKFMLAYTLYQQGYADEARSMLSELTNAYFPSAQDKSNVYYFLGLLELDAKDPAAAASAFQEAIRLWDTDPWGYAGVASALLKKQGLEEDAEIILRTLPRTLEL